VVAQCLIGNLNQLAEGTGRGDVPGRKEPQLSKRRTFGSVRRLPSGRWQARYSDPTGREQTADATFASKAEATRFLTTVEADMARAAWLDPALARMTFAGWVDNWWATTVNLRPKTRDGYRYAVERHLLPAFGPVELGQLTPLAVRLWLAQLSASDLAPATVAKAFRVLHRILAVAVETEVLHRNPASTVASPVESKREMRFLTPEEVATLADAIDPRFRAMVLVGCYCGLRWGELAGLRRSKVDLLQRTISVVQQVTELEDGSLSWGPPKTKAGRRGVPVPSFVAETLAAYVAAIGANDRDALVFPGPSGGVLRASNFRHRFWLPAVRAAGVDGLRVHDMRHTAAALAIAAGAHPKALQERLGHASIAMTLDRYGHLFPSLGQAVADELDRLGRGVTPPPGARVMPLVSGATGTRLARRRHTRNTTTNETSAEQDVRKWALRDSNPRPPPCKGDALAS
jgi:integrase